MLIINLFLNSCILSPYILHPSVHIIQLLLHPQLLVVHLLLHPIQLCLQLCQLSVILLLQQSKLSVQFLILVLQVLQYVLPLVDLLYSFILLDVQRLDLAHAVHALKLKLLGEFGLASYWFCLLFLGGDSREVNGWFIGVRVSGSSCWLVDGGGLEGGK